MQHDMLCQPAATAVRFAFEAGESLTCETGSMVAMSSGMSVQTTSRSRGGQGGLLRGLKRMLAGENFFLNHFTADRPDQWLVLAPGLLGDCVHHPLRGGAMIVQGSGWLASGGGIEIDTSWQGTMAAVFSGESLFWVKCSGSGDLFLSSYGAIYPVRVDGSYVVDTGHVVAFEDTLSFKIRKSGRTLFGSFASGEGLVCRFEGQGLLYCQSHNPPSLGRLLGPMLKPR